MLLSQIAIVLLISNSRRYLLNTCSNNYTNALLTAVLDSPIFWILYDNSGLIRALLGYNWKRWSWSDGNY